MAVSKFKSVAVTFVVLGITIGGFVWVFFPRGGRPPAYRANALNCLKQFALAMHSYSEQHGTLPPPAIYSAEGRPLLSWRVLLLPYLEEQALYRKFRLNEAWDSPHNLALLDQMPIIFDPLIDRKTRAPHTTPYRVFVGRGAAFEGRRGISLGDFSDGLGSTLLVVEATEAVPWTKPAELAFAPEATLPPLGGRFRDIILTAFADGSAPVIARTTSEEALRAVITRNGGEGETKLTQ